MDWSVGIWAAVIGYVLGSISFARVVSRLVAPQVDVTQTELTAESTGQKFQLTAVSGTAVSVHLGPKWRVGPVKTHPACIGALRAKKRGQSID